MVAMMAGGLAVAARCGAQVTNIDVPVPATKLEALEITTGRIVVKGATSIGSMSAGNLVVSLTCEEAGILGSGRKDYGIRVVIADPTAQMEDRAVIDYDELEGLLGALDTLEKMDWSVTALSSFDAGYVTKSGLRVAAFSDRSAARIEYAIRGNHMYRGAVLSLEQIGQFRAAHRAGERAD
jgi:hypothetical protein